MSEELRLRVYPMDCLDVLPRLKPESVDAVVCDPPYGLEFMGKEWDSPLMLGKRSGINAPDDKFRYRKNSGVPSWGAVGNPACRNCGGDRYRGKPHGSRRKCGCARPDFGNHMGAQMRAYQQWCQQWAIECLRVLKPGGYLAAFGGTRTYHRLACAVEDAGFEIRDSLHWLYGSGFPKSLDVGKAIDKAAGATREVIRECSYELRNNGGYSGGLNTTKPRSESSEITAPATEDAARWDGWGTALKPAHEPIILARKPLAGTVAGNVLAHGTGALNVDGCRVGTSDNLSGGAYAKDGSERHDGAENWRYKRQGGAGEYEQPSGRWPPNVLLTHSVDCNGECAEGCPVASLDGQSAPGMHGAGAARAAIRKAGATGLWGMAGDGQRHGDTGGASRFLPTFAWSPEYDVPFMYQAKAPSRERPVVEGLSGHPTVKPLALMRWLVRLVTPRDGVVLDPFAGTGTTGQACLEEGFRALLCERDLDSIQRIKKRLEWYRDWAC